MAKPRVFVENTLALNEKITIEGAQAHYLLRVMRMREGDEIVIFNGQSASYFAQIQEVSKKHLRCEILAVEKPFQPAPDIQLAFAPIKKARTDFIVEKATELGVCAIFPMITEFTNSERVNIERLQAHAIEATEQCGGNFIPKIHEPQPLKSLLQTTIKDKRQIIFCDETAANSDAIDGMSLPLTIFIGPEGGFSQTERALFWQNNAITLSLGPRILRADTAAIAALTLCQSQWGDW